MFIRSLVFMLAVVLALTGCTPAAPFRKDLRTVADVNCPAAKITSITDCATVTPEVDRGNYELHFVEFDDQGWLFPAPKDATRPAGTESWNQIDHLMTRLTGLLDSGELVHLILYVHGWKHNAKVDDEDLKSFRTLLMTASKREGARRVVNDETFKPRKTVGIYVGWRGKSWDLPGWMLNMSFWTRKTAANHVALGSVQELFARLRAIQSRYNSSDGRGTCVLAGAAKMDAITTQVPRCPIRSLMIGHSFGASILYAAVAPPLIESLSAGYGLPPLEPLVPAPGQDARNERRGGVGTLEPVADLVVLLNPAFEATRFDALRRAADRYRPRFRRPPAMVIITSDADWATKYTFPIGRFVNTMTERPVSSAEQSLAIRTTPGHMDPYITHRLTLGADRCSEAPRLSADGQGVATPAPEAAAITETGLVEQFYQDHVQTDGTLAPSWTRHFCGGAQLATQKIPSEVELQTQAGRPTRNPNPMIWNVRTTDALIAGHSDIMKTQFIDFVRQLYGDVTLPCAYGDTPPPVDCSRTPRASSAARTPRP